MPYVTLIHLFVLVQVTVMISDDLSLARVTRGPPSECTPMEAKVTVETHHYVLLVLSGVAHSCTVRHEHTQTIFCRFI